MLHVTILMVGLAAAPPSGEKPKIAILELTGGGGIEPSVVSAVGEAVAAQIGSAGYFRT